MQNAADAAQRAGAPTRVVVRVVGTELRVAARGEPLDAAGVAALASLRASAKRAGEGVGRFGVGFAAVTAVSDAPRLVTRRPDGTVAGVAFDRLATAREVDGLGGGAAAELTRRGGDAPALRLVWPTGADEAPLDAGVTTEVRLPLRDGAAPAAELLATARAQAPDLLLALRWVDAVEVDGEEIRRTARGDGPVDVGDTSWRLARVEGELPAALLAGLPVEEREAVRWEATWAVREDAPVGAPREVLHAPTPTDEVTTLPARLVATVPLDPDRRHVRPGPVTTHVLRAAAWHYPELVAARSPQRRVELVPRPALPASEVDALLRDAVLEALATRPWVPAASGDPLVARRAVVLDVDPLTASALAPVLAGVLPDLAHPAVAGPAHAATLASVGVTRLGPAGLADALAGLDRPPEWWRAVYEALALDPAAVRGGELAALPVPLADGRTVLGARGCLLPDGLEGFAGLLADAGIPGLRLVAPAAAHPLLTTLGARTADAAALLAEPSLRAAVDRSPDDADAGLDVAPLARLVLALVDAAPPEVGTGGWLGALALPAEPPDGCRRADELVLPDAALRPLLPDDTPLGVLAAEVTAPRAALLAVGVLDGFAVLRDDAPTGPDHDLDDEERWWDERMEQGESGPLLAVRDLDLVDPARWAAAWPVLASDREVRAAVAPLPGGTVPYTAWWLARHARLGGRPPTAWRTPAADDLAGLVDPVPPGAAPGVDPAFLAACGVRARLGPVADAAEAADLLDRLGDPDRPVAPATVLAVHAALAAALANGRVDLESLEPPARVRAADGSVVDADPDDPARAPVVVDRPWVAAVLPRADVVEAPPGRARDLADLLDLETADERYDAAVTSGGTPTPWAVLPGAAAWSAALGRALPTGEMVRHERLRVVLTDRRTGRAREVTPGVWVVDAVVHADDPLRAVLAPHG